VVKINEYKLHKYFAKTLFLGKKVEYLTQCHSTNDLMASHIRNGSNIEGDIIVSGFQSGGKGQRGNVWVSEPDKNLLFSLNLRPTFLEINKVYLINVMIGVAILQTLNKFIPNNKIEIKWPNDIYVNDSKIAGVLVETFLGKGVIDNVIVGIGLNVNQTYFPLSTATSMLKEANKTTWDLSIVLEDLLLSVEAEYIKLKSGDTKSLLYKYQQALRWRGEIHQYQVKGENIDGEIIGINDKGRLVVKHNNRLASYDLKEIRFMI
jgi:BirA family biotin operon repressor/biotin-[acetyl-CoA-carboxylase] ligase